MAVPFKVALPDRRTNPSVPLINVDLPAPLGPMIPVIFPGEKSTDKSVKTGTLL